MENAEFVEITELITNDATTILHNQQVLAGIHTKLEHNLFNPLEQDFIYEDHYGQRPSEPHQFIVNDVTITTRILHQTGVGLRDIVGADLLYEIESKKFGLIQYKRASSSGSVKNDVRQLEILLDNCPEICSNQKKRPIPTHWLPIRLNSFCGAWYCVFDGKERKYVHACEAESIFNGKGSTQARFFKVGIAQDSFLELFASCRIGALLQHTASEDYTSGLLEQKHIIFEVQQQGEWL